MLRQLPTAVSSLTNHSQEARERCAKTLQEVERRFPKGLPVLDPEEDMKVEVT